MFEFYFPPEGHREGMAHVTRLSHSCDNPNWHFALHVHQQDVELLYITGGRASLMVGTRQVAVEAGDILLIKPGTSHSTTSDPNDPSNIWSVSLSHVSEEMLAGFPAVPWAKAGEHAAFLQAAILQLQKFSRQLVPATQLTCDYIGNSLLTLYGHHHSCFWRKTSCLVRRNVMHITSILFGQRTSQYVYDGHRYYII